MARRGRVIGLALGLVTLFLYLTSRHSGSHPRDLDESTHKTSEPVDELRAILKEPPGKWDPFADKFKYQQTPDGRSSNTEQNQLDESSNEGSNPVDEGIRRKSPKKGVGTDSRKIQHVANNAMGQDLPKKAPKDPHQLGGSNTGSGAVILEEEIVPAPYDPTEGPAHKLPEF